MAENFNTPQDDAERIRLKRLAKLQDAGASGGAPASVSDIHLTAQPRPAPLRSNPPSLSSTPVSISTSSSSVSTKKKVAAILDLDAWEHENVGYVFKVTLERSVAEHTGYETVWLKQLAEEFASEGITNILFTAELADRILIARLELDPHAMSDDLDYLPVLVSLPGQETTFEYLVGAWKRVNASKSTLLKKGYSPHDTETALSRLEKLRDLLISYAGLTLQEPEMFPQPAGRPIGPPELIAPLLSFSSLTDPLLSTPTASPNTLTPSEIEQFLQELARRFEADNELLSILGPVVKGLLFHESLFRPEGIIGVDTSWRGVIGGLETLVSIKSIAVMISRMEEWNPPNATAATLEVTSLLGPICRLGVFPREWPIAAQSYFSEPDKRSREDIESSFASLRGTLKSLQSSLFHVFNALVRVSPESREAVLRYFSRVISLNSKRAGMQVDPATVASDSFLVNIQNILLRFAEPFMDANYTKIDRIDPLFYVRSSRINIQDETRIKATSEEASEWENSHRDSTTTEQNFISNVFYLTVTMSHYGLIKTIQTYSNLAKHHEDLQRHLDMINGDGSWMGSPMQARVETAISQVKTEQAKIRSSQLAFEAQLAEPEFVSRSLGFTTFLSTWLLRQVDPKKMHPNPLIRLPLPEEVPMKFRVLPEYILENIIEYQLFVAQSSPDKFELAGKVELMTFILTFLNSTWYIKNPFLKSKINDVLFMSIWGYGRERHGVLGNLLNTHPMALKYLMPALMHFYIEVEQTGASSQFYDKFSALYISLSSHAAQLLLDARRNISYVLKVVWDNPTHRQALSIEAKNVDKFVRFVNLMINDVTYLMDESLSEMAQIHDIQVEMDDTTTWNSQTQEYRREREGTLHSLERHASGYTTLCRSTVELLKVFTAETKAPFMMPEIVNRLAAMLDYNLVALVGPKYQGLKVRDPEKLKFNPKSLLSDILQVFLNLSDEPEFIKAVAGDGRSYSKALFDSAARIATQRGLKSSTEIEQLQALAAKVEESKLTMEAEDEDLGDIPDEFLDPLMATVMKDPVRLPSSRVILDRSTIKSHLLSDTTDPFNRTPLRIGDVIPETDLKGRIDAFLLEHRSKAKS